MDVADHAAIWASFSVSDHLKKNAFLAEVVMYDKLVVPVPPADEPAEWERWEAQGWNPSRQRELLGAMGTAVELVPWNDLRRGAWERNYVHARSSAGTYLRQSLAMELTAMGLFDAVPAMAMPVVATTPYDSLQELVGDLGIERRAAATPLPASVVSAVVGRELLVPHDDSRSELDLLREAVDVVTNVADYRNAREALHARLGRFARNGVTDAESLKAAVKEINDASEQLRRAVRGRKVWTNAGRLFSFAQIVLGALATPLTPLGIGMVVAGVGQFTATEKLADPHQPKRAVPDIAMLLDVRHELDL